MEAARLIDALERFGAVLPAVVSGIAPDDARWRPHDTPGTHWSILEVVMHLGDEEVEDFRARLRLTIEAPQRPWPPIDPVRWAVERKYNEANLDEAVERFVSERAASARWLRGLDGVDWSTAHASANVGVLRAGDLLASWAAHDALHLRQIARRLHQIVDRDAAGFSTRYAGEW